MMNISFCYNKDQELIDLNSNDLHSYILSVRYSLVFNEKGYVHLMQYHDRLQELFRTKMTFFGPVTRSINGPCVAGL